MWMRLYYYEQSLKAAFYQRRSMVWSEMLLQLSLWSNPGKIKLPYLDPTASNVATTYSRNIENSTGDQRKSPASPSANLSTEAILTLQSKLLILQDCMI
jgi:hypothetical protein